MATPFLGELRMMSFDFSPKDWAECNGQLLSIEKNQKLFSLLKTTYGGDGKTTFGLPDLRGRLPIHVGPRFSKQGEKLGEEFHKLTQAEMPEHRHGIVASSKPGNQAAPAMLASTDNTYRAPDELTSIHPATLPPAGGDQGHENRHPLLVLTWCIALDGIFPEPD